MEFHRHGLALTPDPSDRKPGVAFWLNIGSGGPEIRSCSCSKSKKKTCPHILELVGIYKSFLKKSKGRTPYELFRSSLWHRLASILGDNSRENLNGAQLAIRHKGWSPIP